MTHYMELLATNQPWNLILFMAIPVILAETIAITELTILFRGNRSGTIGLLSRISGIIVWWYFLGVFGYLFTTAVIPLTIHGWWRGIADIIAVGSYLLGIVPLMWIALIDMNVLYSKQNERSKLKLHATFVGIFLIVAHVAMIFGMLNPTLLGYTNPENMNTSMNSMNMEQMNH